jgi:hypothetical protein
MEAQLGHVNYVSGHVVGQPHRVHRTLVRPIIRGRPWSLHTVRRPGPPRASRLSRAAGRPGSTSLAALLTSHGPRSRRPEGPVSGVGDAVELPRGIILGRRGLPLPNLASQVRRRALCALLSAGACTRTCSQQPLPPLEVPHDHTRAVPSSEQDARRSALCGWNARSNTREPCPYASVAVRHRSMFPSTGWWPCLRGGLYRRG